MKDAKQLTQDTKEKAIELHNRISSTGSFQKDENKTKELIQQVKHYLTG